MDLVKDSWAVENSAFGVHPSIHFAILFPGHFPQSLHDW